MMDHADSVTRLFAGLKADGALYVHFRQDDFRPSLSTSPPSDLVETCRIDDFMDVDPEVDGPLKREDILIRVINFMAFLKRALIGIAQLEMSPASPLDAQGNTIPEMMTYLAADDPPELDDDDLQSLRCMRYQLRSVPSPRRV